MQYVHLFYVYLTMIDQCHQEQPPLQSSSPFDALLQGIPLSQRVSHNISDIPVQVCSSVLMYYSTNPTSGAADTGIGISIQCATAGHTIITAGFLRYLDYPGACTLPFTGTLLS